MGRIERDDFHLAGCTNGGGMDQTNLAAFPLAAAFPDVPARQYFACPGRSASQCKQMAGHWRAKGPTGEPLTTPRSYEAIYISPDRRPWHSSAAMAVGSAVHAICLLPDWRAEIFVSDDANAVIEHKVRLTSRQFEVAQKVAQKVGPKLADLERKCSSVMRELSLLWLEGPDWSDPGGWRKARIDWLGLKGRTAIVVDLKVTDDPRPRRFRQQCETLNYYVQAAQYVRGVRTCLADVVDRVEFYFLAASRESPRIVCLHEMPAELLAEAETRRQFLLGEITRREAEGDWLDPWEDGIWSL